MFIKQILKKIITVYALSVNNELTNEEIDQINGFVFCQIRNLPSTHRFIFYFLTIFFFFMLFLTHSQAYKIINHLLYSNFFIVKKYLQSIQSLVSYFISSKNI